MSKAGTKFTDKKEPVQYEKQITVIIPMGLPGVGKSTLHDEVMVKYFRQNKDVKYTMVSNDQIRSELVKEYQKGHPGKSIDEVYQNTRHLLKDGFEKKLEEVVAHKSTN